MHRRQQLNAFMIIWVILFSLLSGTVWGLQVTNKPASAPVVVRPPSSAAPLPDPLTILQQSGIDSTLISEAEFDPPTVTVGAQTTYRVVITAMTESVTLPQPLVTPPGLTLTPAGKGLSFASLGPVVQPRMTYNFRVTASAPGAYTMPAFNAAANGKTVTVPEARLTVTSGPDTAASAAPRLQIELPGEEFYVGQAIPVSVVLLDAGNNLVQAMAQTQLSGDAFLSDTAVLRQRRELRPRNGLSVPALIQEMIVVPIKEGRHSLVAQAYAYYNRPLTNRLVRLPLYHPLLDSDPIEVTVKRLPTEGELPGFTGAIGVFQLEVPKLSTNEARVGDPLTLTVTVKGTGNLPHLIPPKAGRLRDWQVFAPVPDLSPSYVIQQRGSYVFSYTLIPVSAQVKATPAIPFSYFDPLRRAYIDLTIPPVPLKVTDAPGGQAQQPSASPALTELSPLEDDIAPERELIMAGLAETRGKTVATLVPLQQRSWFLLLQLIPALLVGGLWFWDWRRRFLAQHPGIVMKQRARRGLRRQLRRARQAAATQDTGGFVLASINALREACAPFESANPEALVCADILRALPPGEREGREGALVRKLFSAAEAARFTETRWNGAPLIALRPEVERLLTKFRERL